jgi:hypothetical protein
MGKRSRPQRTPTQQRGSTAAMGAGIAVAALAVGCLLYNSESPVQYDSPGSTPRAVKRSTSLGNAEERSRILQKPFRKIREGEVAVQEPLSATGAAIVIDPADPDLKNLRVPPGASPGGLPWSQAHDTLNRNHGAGAAG